MQFRRPSTLVLLAAIAGVLPAGADAQVLIGTAREGPGWLGITTISGKPARGSTAPGPQIVLTVDPLSPAQRAGIVAGDTLMTYDSVDVRTTDSTAIQRILRPGRRVTVKWRRNGIRNAVVEVQESPQKMGSFIVMTSPGSIELRSEPSEETTVNSIRAVISLCGNMEPQGALGFEMITFNTDFAEVLGLHKGGVVITSVTPQSPAAHAGLRSGDVIVSANGVHVSDADVVMKVISGKRPGAAPAVLALDVTRKGKSRKITIRQ